MTQTVFQSLSLLGTLCKRGRLQYLYRDGLGEVVRNQGGAGWLAYERVRLSRRERERERERKRDRERERERGTDGGT